MRRCDHCGNLIVNGQKICDVCGEYIFPEPKVQNGQLQIKENGTVPRPDTIDSSQYVPKDDMTSHQFKLGLFVLIAGCALFVLAGTWLAIKFFF